MKWIDELLSIAFQNNRTDCKRSTNFHKGMHIRCVIKSLSLLWWWRSIHCYLSCVVWAGFFFSSSLHPLTDKPKCDYVYFVWPSADVQYLLDLSKCISLCEYLLPFFFSSVVRIESMCECVRNDIDFVIIKCLVIRVVWK